MENNKFGSLQRTRRNLLAAGGLLAGAAVSLIGMRNAVAGGGGGGPGGGGGGGGGPGGGGGGGPGGGGGGGPGGGGGGGPGGGGGHACFLRGTRLLTPAGERKIEDLRIGDLLATLSGDARPITWIGRRAFRRSTDSKHPESVLPVRVAKGALGPDAPHCDLFISRHHALWVDGLFIKAIDLVNGSSITLDSAGELSEIEYLNVKLARHDVIIAEGAASETLLVHSGNVERFDNFAEYLRLFGEDAADEAPCAPIAFGSTREKLTSHLRSAVSPWVDCRNEFDKARDRIEELVFAS
jgi:Hint domain